MKKGFTLLELLIAIVVLTILASITIPTYIKTVEKSRGGGAITNLRLIRVGEGIYKLDEGVYVTCGDLSAINSTLNLEIRDEYFTYTVSSTDINTNFTARAERDSGPNNGEYIEINQDGAIDTSHWSP